MKRHTCESCGKSFRTGTAYDRHMAKEHGTMSFRGKGKSRTSCGHCSHISLTSAEAARHRKSHGLKPHKRVRPDKRSSEQKVVSFFMKHAGSSYTPGKETKAQGKRRGAVALAHAEAEASRRGWRVSWEYSQEPYEMGDAESEMPSEVYDAVLRDENGEMLESLGMIGDPSREYRRVVEAELALEALG
jgi:hypothetical protein